MLPKYITVFEVLALLTVRAMFVLPSTVMLLLNCEVPFTVRLLLKVALFEVFRNSPELAVAGVAVIANPLIPYA